MRFYNTLSRKVEELKPINDGQISLYSCGPTVYDYAHLGNLRAYVFVDTLRRTLELSGLKVKYVMNITDVGHLASDADEGEDKLEKGAKREGKSVEQVASFYTDAFKRDTQQLNILPPNGYYDPEAGDNYARATKFIDQQKDIIKLLLDKGFAYQTGEAIYFDVSKFGSYGELTGQKLEDKEVGAREEVVTDSAKRNPQDFALWFFTVGRFAGHSMRWASDWGEGFPGWHLECSAIVHATLGEPIDIHTGGVDHIGTHHTNEIAQTEAAFGKKLANLWIHNEHILADGRKMSKSLGNFHTLNDVIKKGYDPMALRLLYLQSHYRTQANFTWEVLEAARARLMELRGLADLRWQIKNTKGQSSIINDSRERIMTALRSDLNTPEVLSVLSNIAGQPERLQSGGQVEFKSFIEFLDAVLGLKLLDSEDISDSQKAFIASREEARNNQNWSEADKLRDELQNQKIEINDTPEGSVWYRSA